MKPGEYEMGVVTGIPDYSGVLAEVEDGPPERAIRILGEYFSQAEDEETQILIRREMAPWYVALGLADRAMNSLDAAVKQATRVWGGSDYRTLVVRNSQMYWAGQVGLARRAQELAEDLAEVAKAQLIPGDKLRHAIRNNAARILEFGPMPEMAKLLYLDLVDEFDTLGQEGSPLALTSRHNYADFLRDSGDYAQAAEVFQRLLLILTEYRGISSFNTLAARHELALVTMLDGQRERALDMWAVLLVDIRRFLEPGTQLELDVLGTLLSDALENHDVTTAVNHLDQLLELHRGAQELGISQELAKMRNALLEANA